MSTLTQYRAAAAKLLGPFFTGTATSGSTTSILECTTWPYKSTLSQDDLFKDYYLLRPNAVAAGDFARIVDTYTAATGLFKPDQVYTNSPNGETFELHGNPIEPYNAMADLINLALGRTMVVVESSFTPTAGDERQILNDLFSGISDSRWIYQAGILYSGEQRRQVDPYTMHPLRGTVIKEGQHIYLDWGSWNFAGTELVYIRYIKSAWNHCLQASLPNQNITGATNATPIVVTVAAHGLTDNRDHYIGGVGGNTNANGYWQIKVIDANTFSLNGSGGNGAYTSGGTVTPAYGQQNGLTLEADLAPVSSDWVAAAVAIIAWDRYGHLLEQSANQKLIRDASKAAAWFNEQTEWNFIEPTRTLQPIHSFGPFRYGSGMNW